MTLLCVPIFVEDTAVALMDAKAARDAGADLVEFRVDGFFSGEHESVGTQADAIARLCSDCPLPVILTCRPVLEGGQYDGPDDARIALFERVAAAPKQGEHPPRYIDVELATYARSANLRQKVNLAVDHPGQVREVSTSLILSAHDFHTRPPDLVRRLGAMAQEPAASVVKVAYRARSLRDNLELLDFLAERVTGKPTIALAMGPFGLMSRVLAPKFDAFLTFASLRREKETAPGQPVVTELCSLYRFRAITSSTRLYGVVGWPVEHSLSPVIHNAGFEAAGHDGVFLPLPIMPEWEQFKGTMLELIDHPHLDFSGCAVTVPHKQHLVRLASEQAAAGDERWVMDDFTRACGAANTLVIKRDAKGRAQRLSAANTDGPGAVDALRDALGAGAGGTLAGRAVLVLGAGGTARALALALARESAHVHIHNRTRPRADELAEQIRSAGAPGDTSVLDDPRAAPNDLAVVVNATSAGMNGGPSPSVSPLSDEVLRNLSRSTVVLDCVYKPLRTPLLIAAERAGLKTIDGAAMLVAQAARQFTLWTGHSAPRSLFTQVVRETAA